jgi:TfoX/Sxy family transcriptional regulator of competence genes
MAISWFYSWLPLLLLACLALNMAYNPERTEQVRQRLVHVSDVAERKMFGSIGFIVNGKLCIGVGDHDDHNMMIRVGPERYDEALLREGAQPAIMRRREMKGYVFLTNEALKTGKDLDYWVDLALEFNRKLSK